MHPYYPLGSPYTVLAWNLLPLKFVTPQRTQITIYLLAVYHPRKNIIIIVVTPYNVKVT